jgi:PncC family amidohydrolase
MVFTPNTSGRSRNAIQRALTAELIKRHATLAVAESCTAGGLGAALTSRAGSSAYFLGGVIVYADELKRHLLRVPAALLQRYGAVSEPVARRMALQVRRLLGATYGVSITGIAGPGGGSSRKPVGTVWVAVATPDTVAVRCCRLHGTRAAVRRQAVHAALTLAFATITVSPARRSA